MPPLCRVDAQDDRIATNASSSLSLTKKDRLPSAYSIAEGVTDFYEMIVTSLAIFLSRHSRDEATVFIEASSISPKAYICHAASLSHANFTMPATLHAARQKEDGSVLIIAAP